MEYMTVLYRDADLLPGDAPLVFQCQADDGDHAEEQCVGAYPGCEVVWVVETQDIEQAYQDYYNV